MMKKLLLALGALGAIGSVIAGLFAFGVVSTALEWEPLPCGGFQTENAPFTPAETCLELEEGAILYGAPVPALAVRWTEGAEEGKRFFHTPFGKKAGTTNGSANVEVAFLPTDKPCNTALRHEVRHVLLLRDGKDPDANHELPGWSVYDGCHP